MVLVRLQEVEERVAGGPGPGVPRPHFSPRLCPLLPSLWQCLSPAPGWGVVGLAAPVVGLTWEHWRPRALSSFSPGQPPPPRRPGSAPPDFLCVCWNPFSLYPQRFSSRLWGPWGWLALKVWLTVQVPKDSRLMFLIGRLGFHREAVSQARHWVGGRGDFELKGQQPPSAAWTTDFLPAWLAPTPAPQCITLP